jgi:hypothetical protein
MPVSVPTATSAPPVATATTAPQPSASPTATVPANPSATAPAATPTATAASPAQSTPGTLPSIPADVLDGLRQKAIGYNIDSTVIDFWNATAHPDDLAKVGPQAYSIASRITKGIIVLQNPANTAASGPSSDLVSKAKALTIDESVEPHTIIAQGQEARNTGKLFVVAPTGARLLRFTPDQVAQIAKVSDIFIIQAERWLVEDTSPTKATFIGNVLKFSNEIRAANPQCKIYIEVGRRLDRGGGTADQWIQALSLLYQKDPQSYDGIYLFITRQANDDPNQGIGALHLMIAWLRPQS